MDFEANRGVANFGSANDGGNRYTGSNKEDDESKAGKQKRYQARRKIEDWADFRKMRDELGWMDDFDTEFSEVY